MVDKDFVLVNGFVFVEGFELVKGVVVGQDLLW